MPEITTAPKARLAGKSCAWLAGLSAGGRDGQAGAELPAACRLPLKARKKRPSQEKWAVSNDIRNWTLFVIENWTPLLLTRPFEVSKRHT